MALAKQSKLCKTCRTEHVVDWFCSGCGSCRRYCACRGRAGAIGVVPKSGFAAIGSSSMFIGSRRAIGLELEMASFGSWRVQRNDRGRFSPEGPTYKIDRDGSVHPSELEAVVDPIAGDQQIINGLVTIANHLHANNCTVNSTCGYHVHVDARDYSWHDIQKLMLMWFIIERWERSLNAVAGRAPNTYCQRWTDWLRNQVHNAPNIVTGYNPRHNEWMMVTDLDKFKRMIIFALYGYDINMTKNFVDQAKRSSLYRAHMDEYVQRRQQALARGYSPIEIQAAIGPKPRSIRYVGGSLGGFLRLRANRGWNHAVQSRYVNLNIHSWIYRGTVEYRLSAGTVDPVDVQMVPLFWLWLTEAITRTNLWSIMSYYNQGIDPFQAIVREGGFRIQTINGPSVYRMPMFLSNWLSGKVN